MNIIKDFFIYYASKRATFPVFRDFPIYLDIGERERVCCTTQHSKQWYSVLFKSTIKIIDMLGKLVFKSYIK